jgi:hypothetical protein
MTLFGKSWSVERIAGAYDADGIWQESTTAQIPFNGTVQPANSNEIKAMAQGRENEGAVLIFSSSRLNVSKSETNQNGDIVTFNGAKYELSVEGVFDNGLIPHFKYLAFMRGNA